ncbi:MULTISPECIES: hypothetical protein [unclassified Microbacterium]|uniref:hypothetical protein n=1 Tax=unclassified Microbacterium TaxID=2609290 RepID=UPI003016658B
MNRTERRAHVAFCILVVAAVLLAIVLAVGVWLPPNNPVPATATSAPTMPADPTDAPRATPESPPPAWATWQFTGATLTAAKAGIEHADTHEVRPNEVVTKSSTDASGATTTYDAIEPEDKSAIAWDSQVIDGIRRPIGGVLSASAVNTVYLYCHDYRDGTALCSTIADVTRPGDQITIETAREVLTYTAVETFDERKGSVAVDSRVTAARPGRLLIITCNSAGERDTAGEPVDNTVLVFQLSGSHPR